jgi:hypothetical protein
MESSAGELQMDDMPEDCWIWWNSVVRTRVFIWPFSFRGSASKLCMFLFYDAGRECHERRDLGTSYGGSCLGGDEELAW